MRRKCQGCPSIGNITNKDEALKYAAQTVLATPSTSHFFNDYANAFKENGDCITSLAIKKATLVEGE
jgi:hypothetical protein